MTIDQSSLLDDDYSSGDSLNCERLNPSTRNRIFEFLKVCIKLLKKATILCDKVLPNYMFTKDVEEFKNSKILNKLHSAYGILEGLTERTRSSFAPEKHFQNYKNKRISQTPDVMSSPLLEPVKLHIKTTD